MHINPIPEINITKILNHENNPILKKCIIGKDDVDISAMISKLNNSDWVEKGKEFFDKNNGICPFCQRKTDEHFRNSLSEYFDESFTKDTGEIKSLIDDYNADTQYLQRELQGLIDSQSEFVNIEKLKTDKQLFDSLVLINKQLLRDKQNESSKIVTLESHRNILGSISKIITDERCF